MPILTERVCRCEADCRCNPGMGTVVWGTRTLGDSAAFYPSLWLADLKALLTPGNIILPSDLQKVKDDAEVSIRQAGGTNADVQAAMQQIDATVAGTEQGLRTAGSSLAPFRLEDLFTTIFGNPNDPTSPGLSPLLLMGAAVILGVVLIKS